MSSRSLSVQSSSSQNEEMIEILDKLQASRRVLRRQSDETLCLLGRLKVLGRAALENEEIYSERSLNLLMNYAFDGKSWSHKYEAMKCLANAMLLNPSFRDLFVKNNGHLKALSTYATGENEFLPARILFLSTVDSDVARSSLISAKVGDKILYCLNGYDQSNFKAENQGNTASMNETLKLLYNLSLAFDRVTELEYLVEPLLVLLDSARRVNCTLRQPLTYVINALINMHLDGTSLTQDDNTVLIDYVIHLIDSTLTVSVIDADEIDESFDALMNPIFALLRRVYNIADPKLRAHIQSKLLPQPEDRKEILGKGNKLSARLLRSMGSAWLPNLRESIGSLFFELSDLDTAKMVHNIGFGHASGFLISQNLSGGGEYLKSPSSNGPFNPVTGQAFEHETHTYTNSVDLMDEEEKEREAEKLFVLLERLKKTGIIDVKNPVEEAIQSGRFQDLDD